MTAGDVGRAVAAIADGLGKRVGELRLAEEKLAQFVFTEGSKEEPRDVSKDHWEHFALRALAVAGDPTNFHLLKHLVHDGDASLADIGRWLGLDRLAVVDRVSLLTQAGYVGRDLEHDRIGATTMAQGLVELVEVIVEQAAAGDA